VQKSVYNLQQRDYYPGSQGNHSYNYKISDFGIPLLGRNMEESSMLFKKENGIWLWCVSCADKPGYKALTTTSSQ